MRGLWSWACGLLLLVAFQATVSAAESAIPRPPALERDVQFWVRVYTEINTNAGFLHDQRNLAVVYDTMRFAPNTPSRERQRQIDDARDRYIGALRRLAAANGGTVSAEDQRIREMWGAEGTPERLLEATADIRFQLGQSDRFREGLVRAGAWEAHIAETIANLGLPAELAVLPHVESSFNPAAYSKVGAAGLWQFMRSTGRRYMRIDNAVDDRMDPFRSTEAAAQLLSYNYRLLGSWPLALTAYNHGAAGMRRAKEAMGTDDIVRIVRGYKSPTFGFASRNFYVSFLAALEIDQNPEKYFGTIERMTEAKFHEVEVPAYVPMSSIERALNIRRETLRALNPALLPTVWNGNRHVPKAYKLRLPADGGVVWTSELLAQRLVPAEQYAGQPEGSRYKIRSGDTLAGIAQRYGVSASTLAKANGISTNAKLRAGRTLEVPESQAPTVAAVAAVTPVQTEPVKVSPTNIYVVRRGDNIQDIAKKTGLKEAELLKINRIRNPNYIFEGQRLLLVASTELPAGEAPVAATEPVEAVDAVTASTATPKTSGGVSAAVAQRESAEDAAAVAQTTKKPATSSQPVSAAQADALGPAIGPAIETPQSADPLDYSVSKENTIAVAAAETLGHYADWLGITANRLREVNGMKYGRPVIIGNKVKLDFAKVTREAFEQKRREYHRVLQASYFAAHRILGTEVYIIRRGDTLWAITQKNVNVPVWLIQQYNPDADLGDLKPGTQIVMPKVENVAKTGR